MDGTICEMFDKRSLILKEITLTAFAIGILVPRSALVTRRDQEERYGMDGLRMKTKDYPSLLH
jgi:hypothetical protein